MNQLTLTLLLPESSRTDTVQVHVCDLIIAGWTGRDSSAVKGHIDELKLIGVAPPPSTPMFYRVGADLLTPQKKIDVIGDSSTGEVEFVLLKIGRDLHVGLGSDQTDRRAEAIGVALSKQICPKPIASSLWRWSDIETHWDELMLRCTALVGGHKIRYQEGKVASLLHPLDLLQRYEEHEGTQFRDGMVMFCGTLSATNLITWAEQYELELEDPVLERRIMHAYSVRALPIAG